LGESISLYPRLLAAKQESQLFFCTAVFWGALDSHI
jgi:hypothetical protein